MRLYRSTFTLGSATASPWLADTVFGHLCWSLVRREGEDFLTELFLADYHQGSPPILLSDGFPPGFLPRPREAARRLEGERLAKVERIRAYRGVKDQLKASWLPLEAFEQARRGEPVVPGPQPEGGSRVVSKNQIDRGTNTAGGTGGRLYDFTEWCLPAVEIYWRLADGYEPLVREFLADLEQTGYGKRKAVGYGQVKAWTLEPFDGFSPVPNANGVVALSHFVPAADDPVAGSWTTRVKYGRLGEEAAVGGHPFKKPLLQLAAGSCLRDQPAREWYGQMLSGMAFDPKVVQYAYAFALPLCLPEE